MLDKHYGVGAVHSKLLFDGPQIHKYSLIHRLLNEYYVEASIVYGLNPRAPFP